MPDSDTSSPPLTQHLDDLYALAHALVGDDRAEALVAATYRRATETLPADRPEDVRSWLIHLLRDVYGSLEDDTERNSPVRRAAAHRIAERMLPTAFATCSPHHRLVLTLDVVLDLDDGPLAAALDTDAEAARSDRAAAWTTVRTALRDLLRGPEQDLVETALTEDTLRDLLRAHLTSDARPAPTALRSEVASVLREPAEDATSPDSSSPPSRPSRTRRSSSSPSTASGLSWRRGIAGILSLLLLGAGAYVFTIVLSPAPEPDPSLTTFSARRAESVSPPTRIDSPTEAVDRLRTEWNRRVNVPTIDRARLVGVAQLTVASDLKIPALVYADSTAEGRITVFAYNYALIDRIGEDAQLDTDTRELLSDEKRMVTRREDRQSIVLWRQRDDIFLAVAPHLPPDDLRSRIRF